MRYLISARNDGIIANGAPPIDVLRGRVPLLDKFNTSASAEPV
jgi:hypothetical protein